MAHVAWNNLLRHVRRLGGADSQHGSDSDLLGRFAAGRDEQAFAALIDRHGPMVWGLCRRLLPNSADAEDAFQATFLVLVRRAGRINQPELLGAVAARRGLPGRHPIARDDRAAPCQRATLRRFARQATLMPDSDLGRATLMLLDEEVSRLPERYRVPFVLCHLQGLTVEEAARRLRCPEGTVKSRLSRARERLRKGLTRRPGRRVVGGLALAEAPWRPGRRGRAAPGRSGRGDRRRGEGVRGRLIVCVYHRHLGGRSVDEHVSYEAQSRS